MYLAPGGTSWAPTSDRALKENFAQVDAGEILQQVASLPVETWNLRSQDPSIRHIGPVAQDFYAAFGFGEDDRHINLQDATGVALAAVQGLYQQSQEQAAEITALSAENADLRQQLDEIEARLVALEEASGEREGPAGVSPDLVPWAGLLFLAVGLVWVTRRPEGLPFQRGGAR